MIGIYLIRNKINNKVYVGQSVDISRRIQEHLRSAQPEKYSKKSLRDSKTLIHKAMQKYKIQNFEFSILEECLKEELNQKEMYWINFYNSNNRNFGYNLTSGGQNNFVLSREQHSQAKLTEENVQEIKRLLKENIMSLTEINNLFPQVKKSTISLINTGKTWVDKNEKYPLRPTNYGTVGEKNSKALFLDSEVLEMRKLYASGLNFNEIYKKYSNRASYGCIKAIIYGESYKHLPIFKKKLNKWI